MIPRRGLLVVPRKSVEDGMMEKCGRVAWLAAQSKHYRQLPISVLYEQIKDPLMMDQLTIFYSWNNSMPVGYVSWAFLAPDVEERLIRTPKAPLHPSEWNEGETLWIMDFLAVPGWCEDIVEYIDTNMFAGHSQAFSLKRNRDGRFRKICWKRRQGTLLQEAGVSVS